MITFTPPDQNLAGVIAVIGAYALTGPAIIIGVLVGLLSRRWYDAFWSIPVMLAYQALTVPGFAEAILGNPLTLITGLGALPWALVVALIKEARFRR